MHRVGGYLEAILQSRVAISPAKELFLPSTNSLGWLFGETKFLPRLQINFFSSSQGGSGLSITALILPNADLTTDLLNNNHINKHSGLIFDPEDKKSDRYRIIYLIISTEYCLIFKICTLSLVNSYDRWTRRDTQWSRTLITVHPAVK